MMPRSKNGWLVLLAGVSYLLAGLGLMLAPVPFYETIGHFPPFNRHYMGDLGAFLLPLGVALVWAARNPTGNRILIAVAATGTLLHALNHGYEDLLNRAPPLHWLTQTIPFILFAVLLFVVSLDPPVKDHGSRRYL